MQERKYFRLRGETEDGEEGLYHYEVEDGMIVRQICVVHGRIYWADENDEADDKYGFTDQPEFDEGELPEFVDLETISRDEFDRLWARGKAACH